MFEREAVLRQVRVIREFRLSPPGSGRGVSCDANGAFVGIIPLLKRSHIHGRDRWEPRDCSDLSKQIGKQFGLPIDFSSKAGGLKAIANALNDGNVARAQVATVLLGIPDAPALSRRSTSRSEMVKFIRDLHWSGLIAWAGDNSQAHSLQSSATTPPNDGDGLVKAGYNPDEPRGYHARWTSDGGGEGPNADTASRGDDAVSNSAVYHPGIDPVDVEEVGDPKQLRLNRMVHDAQVIREMLARIKKGFVPTPNVYFEDPRTGRLVVADYVVSMWVPDPESFFSSVKLEPILVRDVKTGEGGLQENQKDVYPHIWRGGAVVPVGDNAAWAGFDVGVPTVIAEMYVGHNLPSDTIH